MGLPGHEPSEWRRRGPFQPSFLWRNNLSYNISLSNPGCSTVSPIMGFRVSNRERHSVGSDPATRFRWTHHDPDLEQFGWFYAV